MSPISAKVVTVYQETHQYRVLVQVEPDKYLGSFHSLNVRQIKPFTGACRIGRLDLFSTEIPD